MSSSLTIDGKTYIPATDAGKYFGYSKDYMLLLSKQEKIDGRKVGHKWYVHLPSAEAFFTHAKNERSVRHAQISSIRKSELKNHTRARVATGHTTALIETLVIVIIGLSLGVTGYVGTTAQSGATVVSGYTFLEELALTVYRTIAGEHSVVKTYTKAPRTLEQAAVSAHIATTTFTSLMVAPDELFTTTTVESISDSFSDPVSVAVDPENSSTGIITPMFKDGAGEAYRFLMVPVTTEASETQ